ncbi:hypothetical protein MB46_02585 [Arthrobacter alpinus]|uniref:glycosyltransferase n=1 Tax=Arthrobacter alpinus TaxID=656366 RepID=UPI0005CA1E85|nr:glycosyltransferase [Arthrobacter alpinus]ALV44568.1 hypothetical protein MB46_02585 [Arthrobacter alpinus]
MASTFRSILACVTSKKLRITILALNYAPEPTGNAPYTSRLAELLAEEGHEIHVLTGYPYYPEWKIAEGYTGWSRREVIRGVHVKRLRHFVPVTVNSLHRMHMELSFGVRLMFAKWHNPDVVLVVSPALFSTALAIARSRLSLSRPSTGIWVQDIYSRGLEETGSGSALAVKIMKKFEGAVLNAATAVTVIHDRFATYVTSEFGIPANRVGTIRNWTHLQPQTKIDRVATRAKYGWSEGDTIVLHAGNIGVKQGLDNVVSSARVAESRGSRVIFVLLGDGNQREAIQLAANGLKNIQFIPTLPDEEFLSTLNSADILLVNELAGLQEMSVPSKLTSYFSTSLPVIAATEHGSTTAGEILLSGAGVRVDPGAPEALLDCAEDLSKDSTRMQELGRAGRLYAESRLSEEHAIIQYSKWLGHLAAIKQDASISARPKLRL